MATVDVIAYDLESLKAELTSLYGWPEWRVSQVAWIARTHGLDCEPIKGGILDIRYNPTYQSYTIRER